MNYSKIKYLSVAVFLIVSLISLLILSYFKNAQLDSFLNLQTKEAEYRYKGMFLFPKDTSDIIFSTLIDTPEVINIFKNAYKVDEEERERIRVKLLKHLLHAYVKLRKYNIQQLHFHLPNNESFLRFHRIGKFGDDLSKVRETVAYVNEFQTPIQGFEEGKIFNGYRFVYPLFDEDRKHIGSVEISHSIKTMVTMYQRAFENSDLNIVLKRDIMEKKLFLNEKKNYEPYILNDKFVSQKSLGIPHYMQDIKENIEDIDLVRRKMDAFENFSISVQHEKHHDLVSFVSIKNPVSKNFIAYSISLQKSQWLDYFFNQYKIQMLMSILIAFLFSIGLYLILKYQYILTKQANEDSLMQVHNRFFFEKYLEQKYKTLGRNNAQLSLIMFDIDFFKKINDGHGHKTGDIALKYLAKIVNDNIRKGDVFARWGGEEFMILVEADLEDTVKIAENLREKIDKLTEYDTNVVHFTCSFGIITLQKEISLDKAYALVDQRLYKAKELGRNRVVSS